MDPEERQRAVTAAEQEEKHDNRKSKHALRLAKSQGANPNLQVRWPPRRLVSTFGPPFVARERSRRSLSWCPALPRRRACRRTNSDAGAAADPEEGAARCPHNTRSRVSPGNCCTTASRSAPFLMDACLLVRLSPPFREMVSYSVGSGGLKIDERA